MTNRIPCAVTTALVLIACNQSVDIDTAADASRIAQASILVDTHIDVSYRLEDVAAYPNLINGLLERGYSEEDVQKILGKNLLRVWIAVEDYAATTSSST